MTRLFGTPEHPTLAARIAFWPIVIAAILLSSLVGPAAPVVVR